MKKLFLSFLVLLALFVPAYAQPTPSKGGESSPPSAATEALSNASKVDGLELPPDQTVTNDEGFVTLQAKTKGIVKWLVISGIKVKYVTVPDNSIIVSIPPQGGLITVFAVAVVDGKITEFARTNITVTGGQPASGPGPVGAVGPAPAGSALHVTFLIDVNNVTQDVATVLNSQQLRQAITAKGNFFRYYDIKSPVVSQKKLDAIAQKTGSSFVVIVQRNDGSVLLAQPMPKTEQEVVSLLQKVGGL